MRLAQIVAARVERTAQRTDRAGIGRAGGHVLGLERVLADTALDRFEILPAALRLARDVIFAVGGPGDQRRGDEGDRQRDEGGQPFRRRSEQAVERADRDDGRDQHGADADRVDVVEMGALELDVLRAQAERLVDDEIGDQRADPGDRDVGVERQRLLQRLVDADLHQQQRHQHVEHQPHHAAGMAVGQPREEVRPRDRAGIGVGDVDLDLRQDDERAGQRQRQIRLRQHVAKRFEIHVRGLGGVLFGDAVAQREEGEERSGHQLERRRRPIQPGPAQSSAIHQDVREVRRSRGRNRRKSTCSPICATSENTTDAAVPNSIRSRLTARVAMVAGKVPPFSKRMRIGPGDRRERQDVENDPERLRPELEAADQRDAVGHQRNDDDGGDQIADRARNAEAHLQRGRENDRLDRKEDEGKGRVDQRGDGRADVTEAGAAGQQVDIDAAFGGMVGNRQSAAEDDDADDQNGSSGVCRAIVKRDGSADGFQRQKRDRAKRSIGDAGGRPSPRALGGEAQRVVFQRLVGNPLIILAPDAVYPLPPCHFRTPHCRPSSPSIVSKPRTKTYVAILRCNIRDLAYLCTAQIQQSCPCQ